jgi:DNA polymerase-3 subunit alpha
VGLVKFDFLGLRTLTIVNWAVETINQERLSKGESKINIGTIPMDDAAAFKLLKSAATTAIFQLESRGMKELIQKLQPDSFDDIIALVALYRPGPLQSGMVDDYVARKHGRQQVVYPHPALEPILKPTYGIILYQEQVMQIAQVLAGYTMGAADLLRRAMGKKKPEEMAKQGKIFRHGAQEFEVDEKVATYVFDLMEKFAGYGFNKSHSAAYAVVSYQTLWLKAHYPAAFMSAVLSADMDHTDKVVIMIDECRAMKLEVKSPDINYSHYKFVASGEDTVIYGLGAVKGVGEAAISGIVAAREEGGPFTDLFDFCHRIDLHKANRRVLEALIRSGAMDGLGSNRASLMAQLPLALKMAEQHHASRNAGQSDLFGMAEQGQAATPNEQIMPHDVEDWSDEQRLQGEKDTLGLYLTGHPIDRYESELAGIGAVRIGSILQEGASSPGNGGSKRRHGSRQVMVAGLAISVSHRQTQRGRMGTVILDDKSGRIEATLFSETYESYRDLLTADKILVVVGSTNYDEYRGGMSIRVDQVFEFEQARSVNAQAIRLHSDGVLLNEQGLSQQVFLHEMEAILSPYLGGGCGVCMDFRREEASVLLEFGEEWQVNPTDELLRRLEGFSGISRVDVLYGKRGG